jgi:hypothetical protein
MVCYGIGVAERITTIDNPLANGGPTYLTKINNSGQIVGFYGVGNQSYSFIYDNGTFTPFEHPNAFFISIYGFNNNGQIFGTYDSFTCFVCLFFYADGKFFDVNLPLPANEPRPRW